MLTVPPLPEIWRRCEAACRQTSPYHEALNNMLNFWDLSGRCIYCLHNSNIKQLIEQQIIVGGAKDLVAK